MTNWWPIQSCSLLDDSAGWLLFDTTVVVGLTPDVVFNLGRLGFWWMPSLSSSLPCSKHSSSPSSSSSFSSSSSTSSSSAKGSCWCASGGAKLSLSPCLLRRLSRLLRSFLSFCRARQSRSSSSSFPCRAFKCPSRRVFYNITIILKEEYTDKVFSESTSATID